MNKTGTADSGSVNYSGSPLGDVSFGAESAESRVAQVVVIKKKRVTVCLSAAGGGREWRFGKIGYLRPSGRGNRSAGFAWNENMARATRDATSAGCLFYRALASV